MPSRDPVNWSGASGHVPARAYLRARLLDLLVGDWSRREDQWRWASFPQRRKIRDADPNDPTRCHGIFPVDRRNVAATEDRHDRMSRARVHVADLDLLVGAAIR